MTQIMFPSPTIVKNLQHTSNSTRLSSCLAPLNYSEPRARNWSVFDLSHDAINSNSTVDDPTWIDSPSPTKIDEYKADHISKDNLLSSPFQNPINPPPSPMMRQLFRAVDFETLSLTQLRALPQAKRNAGAFSEEEEAYSAAIIHCFLEGLLNVPEGVMLRGLLAASLHCSPMRITKKLGNCDTLGCIYITNKIGKTPFTANPDASDEDRAKALRALDKLEIKFLRRLHGGSKKRRRKRHTTSEVAAIAAEASKGSSHVAGPRKGPWLLEEEAYANELIMHFTYGELKILPQTKLRSFLASKLHCDPMRVSKKICTGARLRLRDGTLGNQLPSRVGSLIYKPKLRDGKAFTVDNAKLLGLQQDFVKAVTELGDLAEVLSEDIHGKAYQSPQHLHSPVNLREDLTPTTPDLSMTEQEFPSWNSESSHLESSCTESDDDCKKRKFREIGPIFSV